jgi:hypothetical protein
MGERAGVRRTPKATPSTSTVGRGKSITLAPVAGDGAFSDAWVSLRHADSRACYQGWESPAAIISDGAYGILGFEGDTSDHLDLPQWYEPHIRIWSARAHLQTTLWFWNSEIGWAAVHPVLERHGWRYVNANVWDKGKAHIAGNVHTAKIRRFPVVTELCVQYVRAQTIHGMPLKAWLLAEWKRSGLPLRRANDACGVADAAARKYFDQGHLWYYPPVDKFVMLSSYANRHGDPAGRPYFSEDSMTPMTGPEWEKCRSMFTCPHGVTNVWSRPALRDHERVKAPNGRAVHLNQKPLDLMERIIEASTAPGSVVWEPFGGLFSASLAARRLGRQSRAAEMDDTYFRYGVQRFTGAAGATGHP